MHVALSTWCEQQLGSVVAEEFFHAESMSSVHGVRLADGRRVAVKLRDASARVLACAAAHRKAQESGIDCPRLLAGPDWLDGLGWVSVEEWRDEGDVEPSTDAAVAYARLLRRLVVALGGEDSAAFEPPPPWAHYDHDEPGRVWPRAADPRWDPESPIVPAQLRRLAATARERLTAQTLPPVVGHCDLNGLNVRWAPQPIVHDWDSLAARPEAVLVGIVAVNHVEAAVLTAITDLVGTRRLLDCYQALRPFTAEELEVAWAAGVWVAAYNAAFEHLRGAPGKVSRRLAADGTQRLRLAGC